MKYTLYMKQNFPFAQNGPFCELESDDILTNDVILPREYDPENGYNPHNVRLWVIGHQFGACFAIFASCEQDALDNGVDLNRMDFCLAENQDYDDDTLTPLGNASELFDLSTVWCAPVQFDAARDIRLIVALARAAASGVDNLGVTA